MNTENFWKYVQRGKPDECWLWVGPKWPGGYGRWQRTVAHREMYEREKGPIAPGLIIRHSCDNQPCVNPNHLLCGTPQQNVEDMIRRGRARLDGNRKPGKRAVLKDPTRVAWVARGKAHTMHQRALRGIPANNSKLLPSSIPQIWKMRGAGFSHKAIGEKFGVTRGCIRNILSGRTWKYHTNKGVDRADLQQLSRSFRGSKKGLGRDGKSSSNHHSTGQGTHGYP